MCALQYFVRRFSRSRVFCIFLFVRPRGFLQSVCFTTLRPSVFCNLFSQDFVRRFSGTRLFYHILLYLAGRISPNAVFYYISSVGFLEVVCFIRADLNQLCVYYVSSVGFPEVVCFLNIILCPARQIIPFRAHFLYID